MSVIQGFYCLLLLLVAISSWNTATARSFGPSSSLVSSRVGWSMGSSTSSQAQRQMSNNGASSPTTTTTTTAFLRESSSPSSSLVSSMKDQIRGGATLAAKTITRRQFEIYNLFSGGAAGTLAATITSPLEVLKTQLQSSNAATGELVSARGHPMTMAKKIFQQDGVSGFFRGLPPTLIGIIPARSAYFYAYQRSKKVLGRYRYFPEGSPGNALISGLMAGVAGNTLTNPIFMVRTRMQVLADHTAGQRAYNGYYDAITTIFKEEGIAGFYKGITASYWGCTEGALQFIIYEQFKTKLLKRQNDQRATQGLPPIDHLPKLTYFCSAAAAKMVAAIATYPHEVARTRLREQARAGVFKYDGMWGTLRVIAQEEGRQGLYGGMGMHLLKVVPNSALMFLTYEVVRKWLSEFTIVDEVATAPTATTTTKRRQKL